jgi:uncharacterized protein YndB with AHSA1/START domain
VPLPAWGNRNKSIHKFNDQTTQWSGYKTRSVLIKVITFDRRAAQIRVGAYQPTTKELINKTMIIFSKDTANKRLDIVREFKAAHQKVWRAWTESDKLDRWWAPKPWRAETKTMDFKNGGHWLYAMISPGGEMKWNICTFHHIDAMSSFKSSCIFSDEHGTPLAGFPTMYWLVEMSENSDVTTVTVTITFDDVAGLEQIVEMGFEAGFTICLNQLETLLG